MDLSKNKHNCFSAEEAANYIPHTDIVLWVLPSPKLPILSWKLKIIDAEGDLRFTHHLRWSCFVNTKCLPEIILSQRAPS